MCHLVERRIVLREAVDLDQGHGSSETSKGEPYGDVARLSVQMTQFVFKCKILFSSQSSPLYAATGFGVLILGSSRSSLLLLGSSHGGSIRWVPSSDAGWSIVNPGGSVAT